MYFSQSHIVNTGEICTSISTNIQVNNMIKCLYIVSFFFFKNLLKLHSNMMAISDRYLKKDKHSRTSKYNSYTVCPNKRKPVLSVRYLQCHASFNQSKYFILKGIFSTFIWYQTHDNISMHDWKEQFNLMHVKIDLCRIMVLSWYD